MATSAPFAYPCRRLNATREQQERLDETSMTRHEPSIATTDGAKQSLEQEADAAFAVVTSGDTISEASLKIHRDVAQIASKSFENAVVESRVLSNAKVADLAFLNIGELTIGKFLGSGSFSDVQ